MTGGYDVAELAMFSGTAEEESWGTWAARVAPHVGVVGWVYWVTGGWWLGVWWGWQAAFMVQSAVYVWVWGGKGKTQGQEDKRK